MIEQFLRTLMRTTDVLVAGAFSPAAIAAVGLSDVFSRILTRVGLGLGDGTIAMTGQDTGSRSFENRNETISQALLVGLLAGLPFAGGGLFLSDDAIALLGAESDVVSLAAQYLTIIMLVAPFIILTYIEARSIQGIGDTRTPMYVNGIANVVNILITIGLGLGLGPLPRLSIVGVALGTAVGDTLAAVALFAVIIGPWNGIRLVVPSNITVGTQLVGISVPRIVEGMAEMVVEFPFNAILLAFGTEANAAYHIGRRMYQQIIAPLSRGYSVAANVLVGQAIGRGETDVGYGNGVAIVFLAVSTVGLISIGLAAVADSFVGLFTADLTTATFATGFARAYAVGAVFIVAFKVISGALRGGSETRAPFVATLVGTFGFMLGVSYIGGIVFRLGVVAAYAAIILDFATRSAVTGFVYHRRQWIDHGTALMHERGSLTTVDEDP
jgi:putative MATE family efflux protein